jgi:hypothetical protein
MNEFGLVAIGIAFACAVFCGGILYGRATAPKPNVPAVFGELPLHERPQSELHERAVRAEARVVVLEGMIGELRQQLEQSREALTHALWLKDRHWRSLKRVRTKLTTATITYLYPRMAATA